MLRTATVWTALTCGLLCGLQPRETAAQAGAMGEAQMCSETCNTTITAYGLAHRVWNFSYSYAGYYGPDESGGWYFWDCTNHGYGCNIGEALVEAADLENAVKANDLHTIEQKLRKLAARFVINSERSAIQILDCQARGVVAHLEIPEAMTTALRGRFAGHVHLPGMKLATR